MWRGSPAEHQVAAGRQVVSRHPVSIDTGCQGNIVLDHTRNGVIVHSISAVVQLLPSHLEAFAGMAGR